MFLTADLDYRSVLAAAGVDAAGITPELVECPFCRQRTLGVHPDPEDVSDRWFACRYCRFSGDAIALLAKTQNSDDLRQAIERGRGEGMWRHPDRVTTRLVDDYVDNRSVQVQKVSRLWSFMQAGLGPNLHPEIDKRVRMAHLWGGWRDGWRPQLVEILGAGVRWEINRAFNDAVLPKTGFKAPLVLGYQDTPGRICAFQFLGEEAVGMRQVPDPSPARAEGGLAMLDRVSPFEPVVYAIGDPDMALHLHRRRILDLDETTGIVCWNSETRSAWRSLSAGRIILWNPDTDWRIFDQARRIGRAEIADPPDTSRSVRLWLSNTTLEIALGQVRRSAKPWPAYLADWLCRKDTDQRIARDTLNKLQLSTSDRNAVMSAAGIETRERLSLVLGEVAVVRTAYVGNHGILERDGRWILPRPERPIDQQEDLICDSPFRVEYEIGDQAGGLVYWQGQILHQGRSLPFCDPLNLIERDTPAWLRGIAIRAGLGTPFVQLGWGGRLVQLARSFSNPTLRPMNELIGSSASVISFPRFRISRGEVIPTNVEFRVQGLPGSGVGVPQSRSRDDRDTVSLDSAAVVAAGILYAYNLLAPAANLTVRPVLVSGPVGSSARAAADHLFSGADMPKAWFGVRNLRTTEQLTHLTAGRLYPTWVEPQTEGRLSSLSARFSGHAWLAADELEAAALSVGGSWMRMTARTDRNAARSLPPFDDVLLWLAEMQRGEQRILTIAQLAESYCDWRRRALGDRDSEMLTPVQMCLGTDARHPPLLELYCRLQATGRIPVRHGSIDCVDLRFSVVDDHAGLVRLPKAPLAAALRKYKLPIPDIGSAVAAPEFQALLVQPDLTGQSWVIERSRWDSVLTSTQT